MASPCHELFIQHIFRKQLCVGVVRLCPFICLCFDETSFRMVSPVCRPSAQSARCFCVFE